MSVDGRSRRSGCRTGDGRSDQAAWAQAGAAQRSGRPHILVDQSAEDVDTVTHLSACAFARGARGGIFITWIPAANTASNAVVNFASRSLIRPDQEPEPLSLFAEVHQQVPGLLGHPVAGRVGGDPGQVHPAPAD